MTDTNAKPGFFKDLITKPNMQTEVDINAPGVEVKKSLCYFCHQNCGVKAYVKDGKVIKIEGDKDYPTNTGGLCCRGNIALKHIDHPARINHALKRAGEKGENKWEQIPWDQAIKEIAEKLNQIKAESGAEAIANAGGTLRTDDWSRRRFMNLFGSPNCFHNALLCWIPTYMVETALSGWSPFETDLGQSKCVILWGMNPGASAMPGMKGYTDLMKNGLKIIVVDPRYSETASKATMWLPLRPGSDTALSLAMLNVICMEGHYDFDFVDEWCIGFDELYEHIQQYTPEWAAPLTWLDPEQIRAAARMYATNTPSNIQWGCTWDQLGRTAGAGMFARATMRAICGNLDVPGGDLMPGPAFGYVTDEEMEANDRLPEEMKAKQIGSNKFKLTSWPGYQIISDTSREKWGKAMTAEWMCEAHGPSVFKAILTGDPYQIRALIVSATNPVNSYGDSKMTLAALKKVEFLVTCEYWMTPAALYSDYVMPIAGALERPTIHTNYGVTDSMLTGQRAIQPMYDRHTDFTFWRDLGIATGQSEEDWPWKNEEEAFFYMIQPMGYAVDSYDEFVETIRMYYPQQKFRKYKSKGFCTRTGKVELRNSVLAQLGYPELPTYIGPAENEIDDPEVAAEYPIVLTTGGGFMPYHHSEHFQIESIRYLYPDPYFSIHPDLAEKLGIEQGDWCWIETRRGRIQQRANVEKVVDPRVAWVPRGWWFPEVGPDPDEPFGCLRSNTNVLTSVDDDMCDPIGGSWANRGLMCKIYKVSAAETDQKTDIAFSIPGSAKEPGIHMMPSEMKLAYELEPKELIPEFNQPDFEVPEQLTWDPYRKVAYQESTGYTYDKNSGWLVSPEGVWYDMWSGYAYDPVQENLIDMQTGQRYNLQTREPLTEEELAAAMAPDFDVPEGLTWDPARRVAYQESTGYTYDKNSGWLVSPEGVWYDMYTGWAYDPTQGNLVDMQTGLRYDLQTREPLQ